MAYKKTALSISAESGSVQLSTSRNGKGSEISQELQERDLEGHQAQASIDRALRQTGHLWAHLPQRIQDEMRIAIENYLSGQFEDAAGFYFAEVADIWPQVQAVIDSTRTSTKGPRCRIFRDWYELLEPLHEREPQKWLRFVDATYNYVYRLNEPDFSDDAELSSLWDRTNARAYDAATDKPGWIKVWKRKRRETL